MNRATAPASTGVDNWNTVVALNIRRYRLLNGWSQTELGRRFDVATLKHHSQAAMAAMEVVTNGVARRRFDANDDATVLRNVIGHSQVTDAYLAALAARKRSRARRMARLRRNQRQPSCCASPASTS